MELFGIKCASNSEGRIYARKNERWTIIVTICLFLVGYMSIQQYADSFQKPVTGINPTINKHSSLVGLGPYAYGYHLGQDFIAKEGTEVRACAAGHIIRYKSNPKGYGELYICIKHYFSSPVDIGVKYLDHKTNKIVSKEYQTSEVISLYGHIRNKKHRNDKTKLSHAIFQWVDKGELIGFINDKEHMGLGSTEHLHFHMIIADAGYGAYYRGIETVKGSDRKYYFIPTEFIQNFRYAAANYESQGSYPELNAGGEPEEWWIKFKNTGSEIWENHNDNNRIIKLGLGTYSHPDAIEGREFAYEWPEVESCPRLAILEENEVKPGGIGTFRFKIKAPASITPGEYKIQVTPKTPAGWLRQKDGYELNCYAMISVKANKKDMPTSDTLFNDLYYDQTVAQCIAPSLNQTSIIDSLTKKIELYQVDSIYQWLDQNSENDQKSFHIRISLIDEYGMSPGSHLKEMNQLPYTLKLYQNGILIDTRSDKIRNGVISEEDIGNTDKIQLEIAQEQITIDKNELMLVQGKNLVEKSYTYYINDIRFIPCPAVILYPSLGSPVMTHYDSDFTIVIAAKFKPSLQNINRQLNIFQWTLNTINKAIYDTAPLYNYDKNISDFIDIERIEIEDGLFDISKFQDSGITSAIIYKETLSVLVSNDYKFFYKITMKKPDNGNFFVSDTQSIYQAVWMNLPNQFIESVIQLNPIEAVPTFSKHNDIFTNSLDQELYPPEHLAKMKKQNISMYNCEDSLDKLLVDEKVVTQLNGQGLANQGAFIPSITGYRNNHTINFNDTSIHLQIFHPIIVTKKKDTVNIGHMSDLHIVNRHMILNKSPICIIENDEDSSEEIGSMVSVAFESVKDLMWQMGSRQEIDALIITGDLIDYVRDYYPSDHELSSAYGGKSVEFVRNQCDISGNIEREGSNYQMFGSYLVITSLIMNFYLLFKKPVFVVAGNHEVYKEPFGISPRILSRFKPNEGIPADHNLTTLEAIMAFGDSYGKLKNSDNFDSNLFSWFYMIICPFSDYHIVHNRHSFIGLGWGDQENMIQDGIKKFAGISHDESISLQVEDNEELKSQLIWLGVDKVADYVSTGILAGLFTGPIGGIAAAISKIGLDAHSVLKVDTEQGFGGHLPRANKSISDQQRQILENSLQFKDFKRIIFSHFTYASYDAIIPVDENKEGDIEYDIFHEYSKFDMGTFEKNRAFFYTKIIAEKQCHFLLSGHSHRRGIYTYNKTNTWGDNSIKVSMQNLPRPGNNFLCSQQDYPLMIVSDSCGSIPRFNYENELYDWGSSIPSASIVKWEENRYTISSIESRIPNAKPRFAVALDYIDEVKKKIKIIHKFEAEINKNRSSIDFFVIFHKNYISFVDSIAFYKKRTDKWLKIIFSKRIISNEIAMFSIDEKKHIVMTYGGNKIELSSYEVFMLDYLEDDSVDQDLYLSLQFKKNRSYDERLYDHYNFNSDWTFPVTMTRKNSNGKNKIIIERLSTDNFLNTYTI